MIISVTERQTYKRCRRKWDLSSFNRQALTPATTTSAALDLGTLVHKSLADWIIKRRYTASEARQLGIDGAVDSETLEAVYPEMPLPEIFKFHSAARAVEIEAHYKVITGGAKPSTAEMGTLYNLVEMGIAMMENYETFHHTPLPKHMTFAHPEQKVRVPIPNTCCEVCDGQQTATASCMLCIGQSGCSECSNKPCIGCDGTGRHLLEGTLDGLVQDRRGRLFILEHKTYNRRPNMLTLDTSDQFLAYLWILHQLKIAPVGGIAYDGMWKRAKPPRGSTINDLFIRTVLNRTQSELDEFELQLTQEATEMASQPPLYINRQWQGCSDCGYLQLCRSMSLGEDVDYIKRTYYTQRIREEHITDGPSSDESEADTDAA